MKLGNFDPLKDGQKVNLVFDSDNTLTVYNKDTGEVYHVTESIVEHKEFVISYNLEIVQTTYARTLTEKYKAGA